MYIRSVEEAQRELEAGIQDGLAENPEFNESDIWSDYVDSLVLMCTPEVAREFYRREKGGPLPAELERHLP